MHAALPDWIGGIGTAAAFLFAAATFAYSLYRGRISDRRNQAEQCDAWIGAMTANVLDDDQRGSRLHLAFELRISNVSALALRSATAALEFGIYAPEILQVGTIPPNGNMGPLRMTYALDLKRPADYQPPDKSSHLIGMSRLELEFRDSAGNMWNRRFDGRLQLLHKWEKIERVRRRNARREARSNKAAPTQR